MGKKLGYEENDLPLTTSISKRIVRLPLYAGLAEEGLDYCLEQIYNIMNSIYSNNG
jgi:dTDP-4-amino-4,6-dideoxygalactose transaminase